jgi:TrmH family RNA methyltransferase
MIITSLKNDKIKSAVRLRERQSRDEEGLALIEGFRAFSRALDAKIEITEIYFCPELFLGKNEYKVIDAAILGGAISYETTKNAFAKIAYRDRPEGLIGIIRMKKHRLEDIPFKNNGTYLVLESIEKPGNLGSILRSADAAGVSGLILCGKCTDIYNPNVITASTGTVFSMPIAECPPEQALAWLLKHKIKIISTSPHAQKIYCDENLSGAIAVAAGSEQHGLTEFWLKNCGASVRIPMLGTADSLNVATSTTIILYEIAKQKKWGRVSQLQKS